jgi:hypothetical protein
VPTQALYMLNSSFVRQQSEWLADKLLADNSHKTDGEIREAYERVLGRDPSKQELARDSNFLKHYAETYSKLPPPAPAKPVDDKPKDDSDRVVLDPADDIDQTNVVIVDPTIAYKSPEEAALSGLVQTLYASAEFQFLR